MSAFSDYLEQKVLNATLRKTAWTTLGDPYIGLHLAASGPGDTGANELSGNAYARQAATFSAPTTDGTGYKCVTSADITFPVATPSDWGEIGYISIWDASESGNCLYMAALTANKTIAAGDQLKFTAGEISVKLE